MNTRNRVLTILFSICCWATVTEAKTSKPPCLPDKPTDVGNGNGVIYGYFMCVCGVMDESGKLCYMRQDFRFGVIGRTQEQAKQECRKWLIGLGNCTYETIPSTN